MFVRHRRNQTVAKQQKTQDQAETSSAKKSASLLNDSPNSDKTTSADSKTTDQIPASTAFTIKIASASESNGVVSAAAITSPTTTDGYCIFTYTSQGGRPVVSDRINVDGGQCSWAQSANSFDFIGSWNLNVSYYLNDTKAEANQSVTIN